MSNGLIESIRMPWSIVSKVKQYLDKDLSHVSMWENVNRWYSQSWVFYNVKKIKLSCSSSHLIWRWFSEGLITKINSSSVSIYHVVINWKIEQGCEERLHAEPKYQMFQLFKKDLESKFYIFSQHCFFSVSQNPLYLARCKNEGVLAPVTFLIKCEISAVAKLR